jgi:hypothetical protein
MIDDESLLEQGTGNREQGRERSRDAEGRDGQAALPETPKKVKTTKLTDAEWLRALALDPTYSHVQIEHEHGKMLRWCAEKRKQPTRLRFLAWIGRIEKPMARAGESEYQNRF